MLQNVGPGRTDSSPRLLLFCSRLPGCSQEFFFFLQSIIKINSLYRGTREMRIPMLLNTGKREVRIVAHFCTIDVATHGAVT
jgi:hypothetical protein